MKGYKRPASVGRKISAALIGRRHSVETRKKLSESHKGLTPWKGKKHTPEAKQKMREAKLGRNLSVTHRRKIGQSLRGRPVSLETRERIAVAQRGSKARTWKGGKTSEAIIIRESFEYRLWRTAVFERDDYRCVFCGLKGGWSRVLKRRVVLNADHIKPFSMFPELRFAIDNGRTLCLECHQKTPTWGVNARYAKVS